MTGIRRPPKIKKFGVVCDVCGFSAIVTFLGSGVSEYPEDRWDYCKNRNANGLFADECPYWERSLKDGQRLDEEGVELG